jgi:protein-disulfide isomerase
MAQDAAGLTVADNDRILGDAAAPVTIFEYSSLTCPHCAAFHSATLPQVTSEWLDTGKARLVFRHYPLDGLALRAALVADCLSSDKAFFAFINVLFEQQSQWARASDPLAELGKLARLAGVGQAQFEACLQNQEQMDAIIARMQEAQETVELRSTPTFVVNGRKVEGALEYSEFATILEKALQG